jgi:hypothetical protein
MTFLKRHWAVVIVIPAVVGLLVTKLVGDAVGGGVAGGLVLLGFVLASWEMEPWIDRKRNRK